MTDRSSAWLSWLTFVRARLLAAPFGDAPEDARGFHAWHWTMHAPALLSVPEVPAMHWRPDLLRAMAGHLEVEVQAGRNAVLEYEIRSAALKTRMRFGEFLDRVEQGAGNDLYLTANNAAANGQLQDLLAPALAPLPAMLRPEPRAGFLWIGGDGATTPLHHDLTCNLLIAYAGRKRIRLIPPGEQPKLDNHIWVHSRLGWLLEDEARRRRIVWDDIVLEPGQALYVPVGWWHCVRGEGFTVMGTWTNFHWPNAEWTESFPG